MFDLVRMNPWTAASFQCLDVAVIAVDPEQRIFFFSPLASWLTGHSYDAAVGETLDTMLDAHEVHSGCTIAKRIEEALRDDSVPLPCDNVELVRPGLAPLPVEVSIADVRDDHRVLQGFVIALRDISERRRHERALRQAEQKYRSLFENAMEGIFQTTPRGSYISANPGLARMFGFTSPEEMQECVHDIAGQLYVDPSQRAEFTRLIEAHGAVEHFESQIRRRDGTVIWVAESARAVRDGSGYTLYYEGHTEDITLRKRAEIALKEAKEAAEVANRAKSLFLANMSHELRTPLNAIIGYSEMLQEEAAGLDNGEFVRDLEKITAAGKHLLDLINDVLDLSKIEAGKMDVFVEAFDVARLTQEVAATVAPLMQKNGNELRVTLSPDMGAMRSDLTKIRQCLFNLLSNAAKFTEGGVITLDVEGETRDSGEWVAYTVTDTGIGMTEQQIQKVFDAFTQADPSTTRRYGGTGLGLAISRRYCRMLGGDITIRSAPGVGSTFILTLPREARSVGAGTSEEPISSEGSDH